MRIRPGFVLLIATLAGCGGSGGGGSTPTTPTPPSNPVATTSVSMQSSAFTPPDIVVSPGAVVTFTNNDGINHNVTFSSTSIQSTATFNSGSRTVTMPTAAGTYSYTCTLHAGMNGTVKVQ